MPTIHGIVHRRAYRQAKKSVAMLGHSTATEYNWRKRGPPVLQYLSNAQPWVMEAFLAVVKAQSDLGKLPRNRLEEREKTLDTEIMQAVAEMVRVTNTPSATADERVEADHVLMELLAERQGIRALLEEKQRNERGH